MNNVSLNHVSKVGTYSIGATVAMLAITTALDYRLGMTEGTTLAILTASLAAIVGAAAAATFVLLAKIRRQDDRDEARMQREIDETFRSAMRS
jgi:uncharacterized membrane protein YadS